MSSNVLPCAVALLSVCAGSLWIYAHLRPRHTTTAQGSELAAAKQSLSGTAPLPSLLIPCITSHRRTIPTSAIHSFSYPLVYLGVDLDALEAGHLDLGWSRGFVYGGRAWTAVLGIQQGQYLDAVDRRKTLAPRTESQEDPFEGGVGRSTGAKRDSESAPEATIPKDLDRESMASGPSTPSFRSRLLKLLASHGIPAALVGRVWLLTMPSYLGISGINPLTTYFVYRSSSPLEGKEEGDKQGQGPRLLCMVLEVHNTFEERHLYVLRTGLNEDDPSTLTSGHTYSWTFPRSFHVSPFNNRKGYYRLAVQDPFHPSSHGVSTMTTFPKFKVTLNLLTAELEPKLYAVLMNHPTQSPGPITLRNIVVKVLYRQPFSLLMTTPRILAQAWVLHYRKGLVVYPRPEPESSASSSRSSEENSDDSDITLVPPSTPASNERTTLDRAWNPVESDLLRIGRTIGWQSVSSGEKYAEERLVGPWLRARGEAIGVGVRITFTNQERGEFVVVPSKKTAPTLRITTRHPNFFTQLVISETPDHFLLPANTDFHTHVSSPEIFRKIFAPVEHDPEELPSRVPVDQYWASAIRREHLVFLLQFVTKPPPLEILRPPLAHFLYYPPNGSSEGTGWHLSPLQRLMIVRIVATSYYADKLEEWIMYAVGARFVEGQEPWGVWRRVVNDCWAERKDGQYAGASAGQAGQGSAVGKGMTREEEMDRRWGSVVAVK